MKNLEKQYKALANIRRLTILRYLKNGRSASVGEIAGEANLSIKSTSKHLHILFACDFLDRKQESFNVYYFLPDKKPIILKHALELL